MTALGAYCSWERATPSLEHCRRIIAAQPSEGWRPPATFQGDGASLGLRLAETTFEDQWDAQPYRGPDDAYLIVADARLDNREELLSALGLAGSAAERLSDGALVARAWEKWAHSAFRRLTGDFAIVVWDARAREIVLARDPFGSKPLFYHRGTGFLGVASMVSGLHALAAVPRAPDRVAVLERLGLLWELGPGTLWRDIERVEPGHMVRLSETRRISEPFWTPSHAYLRLKDPREYVEGLRHFTELAVRSCLRRRTGHVASHLSAGFDSSVITATAAMILRDTEDTLQVFTAVPRPGYDGPIPPGRIADEGVIAAITAARHSNIQHHRIEPGDRFPSGDLAQWIYRTGTVPLNPCNQVWGSAINDRAQQLGCSVLLTGGFGNQTISFEGVEALPDLITQGRWLTWLKISSQLLGAGRMRLRTLVRESFGPWLPAWIWRHTAVGRLEADPSNYTMLRPEISRQLEAETRLQGRNLVHKGWKDSIAGRVEFMGSSDSGAYIKGELSRWNIDERDPTLNQRLVEFTLTIPPEQFLVGGIPRGLAKRAWSDRLPPEVIDETAKGLQAADWHEQLGRNRHGLLEQIDRLERCDLAVELLDLDRMRSLVTDWPRDGWARSDRVLEYRCGLLRGLATGELIAQMSGSN